MSNTSWYDMAEHDREPPDRGPGGGGEDAQGAAGGLRVGEVGPEATGARPKTNIRMRGATPETSSPSEATSANRVSVNDSTSEDVNSTANKTSISSKVKDLRDSRNIPALGAAINYAQVAAGVRNRNVGNDGSSTKTYRLSLELVSFDNSRNYAVNHDELARLLFEKIRIPGGDCILGYDSNEQQYIHLDIDERVNPESLNLTDGFVIRQGLRMNPIRPVVQDTLVKLFWTPMNMDNEEIKKVLEMFGTVTSDVEYTKFKIRRDAPAATRELEKIGKCSDREVRMKLNMAIPPNIKVGSKKVRVWHHKMKKQCFWCLQLEDMCPFEADGKACKEAKTCEKEDWEKFWEELCKNLTDSPIEEISEESQLARSVAKHMVGSNFPKDVTEMEVQEMFGQEGIEINPEEVDILVLTDSARVTFKIEHLTAEEKDWIMININRKKCRDKRIFIQPLVELTPKKPATAAEAARKIEEEEKERLEKERRINFERSKKRLEESKGRQLTNKEYKKLRRSLAGPIIINDDEDAGMMRRNSALPILPDLQPRIVPDTPEADEGWNFVTSPRRRNNRKSKEVTKEGLPGDTAYGSLDQQLAEVNILQQQLTGLATPAMSQSPKPQRSLRKKNVFDILTEVTEEGERLGDTLTEIPNPALETGELIQIYPDTDSVEEDAKKEDDESNDESDTKKKEDDESDDESDEGDDINDQSPGSVDQLVDKFETKMKGNNKRNRSDSTTPEKNGSPILSKREKKKAKVKAKKAEAKKLENEHRASLNKSREYFMKSPKDNPKPKK